MDGSDESKEACSSDVCNKSGRWKCPGESKCIYPWAVCNGKADCKTGGDESPYLCSQEFCESEFLDRIDGGWKCPNETKCLNKYQVCDGYQNCNDGASDEAICNTSFCGNQLNRGFKCHNSTKCLSQFLVCDGKNDCPEDIASDEFDEVCREVEAINSIEPPV